MDSVVIKSKGAEFTGDLFVNPSRKELEELYRYSSIRGFVIDNEFVVLFQPNLLHAFLRKRFEFPPDVISITLTKQKNGHKLMVTDETRYTKWFHDPRIKEFIMNNTYLNRLGISDDIEYFDDNLFGCWEDL
jgi:hypothetical protein